MLLDLIQGRPPREINLQTILYQLQGQNLNAFRIESLSNHGPFDFLHTPPDAVAIQTHIYRREEKKQGYHPERPDVCTS